MNKKIIATDPALSPIVARLFQWYARGDISLKGAAHTAHAASLTYPKSGAKVPVSTVHTILRNRLYTGWFEMQTCVAPLRAKTCILVTTPARHSSRGVFDCVGPKNGIGDPARV